EEAVAREHAQEAGAEQAGGQARAEAEPARLRRVGSARVGVPGRAQVRGLGALNGRRPAGSRVRGCRGAVRPCAPGDESAPRAAATTPRSEGRTNPITLLASLLIKLRIQSAISTARRQDFWVLSQAWTTSRTDTTFPWHRANHRIDRSLSRPTAKRRSARPRP